MNNRAVANGECARAHVWGNQSESAYITTEPHQGYSPQLVGQKH